MKRPYATPSRIVVRLHVDLKKKHSVELVGHAFMNSEGCDKDLHRDHG